jgi:DNA-binding transcriptional ArsR family regulator
MVKECWEVMREKTVYAKQLAALGNTTRLAIYEQLVRAGESGINVGYINMIVDVPASTFSYHLAKLVNSGLVRKQREGRTLICRSLTGAMDELIMFLANHCCGDDSTIWE